MFHFTLDGEDSAGADSCRLRGGTGGGTGTSSVPLAKLIDETEEDPAGCDLKNKQTKQDYRTFISLVTPENLDGNCLYWLKKNLLKYQKQFNKQIPNTIPFIKINCYKSMQQFPINFFKKKKPPKIIIFFLNKNNITIVSL